MKNLKSFLMWMLFGAVLFWIPAVIMRGVFGNAFTGRGVIILTYVLPLTVLAGLLMASRMSSIRIPKLLPLASLLGIWLFAGLAMTVSATLSGGGFSKPDAWKGILLGAIPPFTLMMASYDGSLFALLLTTFCLLVVWLIGVVRPKLRLHYGVICGLAIFAIVVTAASQAALSVIANRMSRPVSASEQERDDEMGSLTLAIKSAYHSNSEMPPYLSERPVIITISDLQPILSKAQMEVPTNFADFHYCNLEPQLWTVLRKKSSTEQRDFLSALTFDRTSFDELRRLSEYPVAWSPQPDSSGLMTVITISFASDIFRPCLVSIEDFDKLLDNVQSLIRDGKGYETFSLKRE